MSATDVRKNVLVVHTSQKRHTVLLKVFLLQQPNVSTIQRIWLIVLTVPSSEKMESAFFGSKCLSRRSFKCVSTISCTSFMSTPGKTITFCYNKICHRKHMPRQQNAPRQLSQQLSRNSGKVTVVDAPIFHEIPPPTPPLFPILSGFISCPTRSDLCSWPDAANFHFHPLWALFDETRLVRFC